MEKAKVSQILQMTNSDCSV